MPLPQDELEHYSAWKPLMRIPVQSGVIAQQALDTFPVPWPMILLVEDLNDGLVNEIADRLQAAQRGDVYVELGNELNGVESPGAMNAFYLRSIARLNMVSLDKIITCGVANIEPKTLNWLRASIEGLPPGIRIGFHAYAGWMTQRAAFVDILDGRVCAMTEWGSFNLTPEGPASVRVASDLQLLYDMGAETAVWYAGYSGTEPNQDFGLYNQFKDQWRLLAEQALKDARR